MAGVHKITDSPRYLRGLREKIARNAPTRIVSTGKTLDELPDSPNLAKDIEDLARKGALSVAVVEVDGLGALNRRGGEELGNRFLKDLVGLLGGGGSGPVYRLSGDRFALAMPGVAVDEAAARMEGIRAKIEEPPSGTAAGSEGRATVSIGVAGIAAASPERAGLVAAAEAAVVEAKKTTNRVVVR